MAAPDELSAGVASTHGSSETSIGDLARNAFRELYRDAWTEPRVSTVAVTQTMGSLGADRGGFLDYFSECRNVVEFVGILLTVVVGTCPVQRTPLTNLVPPP